MEVRGLFYNDFSVAVFYDIPIKLPPEQARVFHLFHTLS